MSNNAPSSNKETTFPRTAVGRDDKWAQASTEWGLVECSRRGGLANGQDPSSALSLSHLSLECWSSGCCFAITGHLVHKGQRTATNYSSRLPPSWILIKGEKLVLFQTPWFGFPAQCKVTVGPTQHPTDESHFTFAEQEGADSTMCLLRVFPHCLEGALGWDSSYLFIS